MEKRHYRNGYHITWNKNATVPGLVKTQFPAKKLFSSQESQITIASPAPQSLLASAGATHAKIMLASQKKIRVLNDTCGDIILFRNGDEVLARVLEISPSSIKYRRCDNLNGPVFVAAKESIFKITYLGGNTEVFKAESKPEPFFRPAEKPVQKTPNGFAIASFVCSFFFWLFFIPGILAFIFGMIGLKQINANPDKFNGKWMAIFGTVIGALCIVVILISLAAVALL